MMTKKSLLKIKGLSETKVDKIKEAAVKSQVSLLLNLIHIICTHIV